MRKPLCSIVALFAVACFGAPVHAQGDPGFLRGQGNLDFALTYALDTYDEFWVGTTKVSDPGVGRIKRHTVNLWGAYGLSDDLDIAASASWVQAESSGIFPTEEDLQDMTVQLKWRGATWRLGQGNLNLLAAPAIKFPLTSYEDDAVTAIGDGQVDLRARGILQYHMDNGAFIALETGYDFRFDDPHDELPIHLMAGFTPWEIVTFTGFYTHIHSRGGHDIGEGPFPGVREEYDRVGAGAYVRIGQQFGVLGNIWTTIDGRNTGDVDGFSIGGVVRF